jgi:hypothetical protein
MNLFILVNFRFFFGTLIGLGSMTKALGGFININGLVGTAFRKRLVNKLNRQKLIYIA